MGAFFLVFEPQREERERLAASLDASLRAQGFGRGDRVALGSVVAAFYGKLCGEPPQLHVDGPDSFAGIAGTAVLDGDVGVRLAGRLCRSDVDLASARERMLGNFCLVLGDRGRVRLCVDPFGLYHVYRSADSRVFSSSFVAVAQALGAIEPDPQGVYEYAFLSTVYGDGTVAREIRRVERDGEYSFDTDVSFRRFAATDSLRPQETDVEALAEACLDRLDSIFAAIGAGFGEHIGTALSGGYDTRLMLALLWHQGLHPAVHVYGASDSPDVVAARAIADGEGFVLEHCDKNRLSLPQPTDLAAVVERNFLAFDGWPITGIFDSGADFATRQARAAGGRLMLNGGGGEILRSWFHVRERTYAPLEIAWSVFSRHMAAWCTSEFDEDAHLNALADKISARAGGSRALARAELAFLFSSFRCSDWMGRNNSVNHRFGWALTPFVDRHLTRLCAGIPWRHRRHGRLAARLIRARSPRLAGYPSAYGHRFDEDPPLTRRIVDRLLYLRPPRLRRYAYAIELRGAPSLRARPEQDRIAAVVDVEMPLLSKFFHVGRVRDPQVYARIATLEYLFDRLGSATRRGRSQAASSLPG